jgi:hypothetical protein
MAQHNERPQQDGSDYLELQKKHKKSVKLMDGIVTYFEKYTEHTTDPTAISSGSTATSTALGQAQRVQRPAFGAKHVAPPPTDLDDITKAAPTAASNAALASGASTTSSTALGQLQRVRDEYMDARQGHRKGETGRRTNTAIANKGRGAAPAAQSQGAVAS